MFSCSFQVPQSSFSALFLFPPIFFASNLHHFQLQLLLPFLHPQPSLFQSIGTFRSSISISSAFLNSSSSTCSTPNQGNQHLAYSDLLSRIAPFPSILCILKDSPTCLESSFVELYFSHYMKSRLADMEKDLIFPWTRFVNNQNFLNLVES